MVCYLNNIFGWAQLHTVLIFLPYGHLYLKSNVAKNAFKKEDNMQHASLLNILYIDELQKIINILS